MVSFPDCPDVERELATLVVAATSAAAAPTTSSTSESLRRVNVKCTPSSFV
jgi:hypothetical protein